VNESIAAALDALLMSAREVAAEVGSSKTSVVMYRRGRQGASTAVAYRLSVFLRYHVSRLRIEARAVANEIQSGRWRENSRGRAPVSESDACEDGPQQVVGPVPIRRADALRLAVARALDRLIVTQATFLREIRWHRLALWRVRTGRVLPFRSELVALEAVLRRRARGVERETNVLERVLAEEAPAPKLRKPSVRVCSLILQALSRSTTSDTTRPRCTAPEIARQFGLSRVSVNGALEWMSRQPDALVYVLHARYRIIEGRRLPRAWALTTFGVANAAGRVGPASVDQSVAVVRRSPAGQPLSAHHPASRRHE
jgi:hypothetical protein